jgi:hypothetical protein
MLSLLSTISIRLASPSLRIAPPSTASPIPRLLRSITLYGPRLLSTHKCEIQQQIPARINDGGKLIAHPDATPSSDIVALFCFIIFKLAGRARAGPYHVAVCLAFGVRRPDELLHVCKLSYMSRHLFSLSSNVFRCSHMKYLLII